MTDEKSGEDGRRPAPPYVSFKTLLTFIAAIKEHGVPSRIDRSVLPTFSGAVAGQLITALRFLDLIKENGEPTTRLHGLVKAYGTDAYKAELGGIITDAYQPLFDLDLASASPSLFNERFSKAFSAEGDTMRKCVTFFLNAAREADIPVSPYIMKARKPRNGPTRTRAKKAKKTIIQERRDRHTPDDYDDLDSPSRPRVKAPAEMLLGLLDPEKMDEAEQQAIWTLLKYVKAQGL